MSLFNSEPPEREPKNKPRPSSGLKIEFKNILDSLNIEVTEREPKNQPRPSPVPKVKIKTILDSLNPEPLEHELKNQPSPSPGLEGEFKIIRELDPSKVQTFQNQIQEEQNLSLGILAGGAAAVLGAAIWAGVSYLTGSQFMWIAFGVAILVGWSVRQFGRGMDTIFGIVGAVLAMASCLTGSILSILVLLAQDWQKPVTEVIAALLNTPIESLKLFTGFFSLMDLLFFAFAAYYGYRYSIRQMTAEERESLYRTRTVVA